MFKSDKEELAFYRRLHQRMHGSIYVLNLDPYRIEWVAENPILGRILGMSRTQILEEGDFIATKLLSNPDFSESVELAVHQFGQNPDVSWSGIFRIRHNDGSLKWIVYSTSTLQKDEDGNATKAVCVALDPSGLLNTPLTLEHFLQHLKHERYKSIKENFTPRQSAVLDLLLESKTDLQIASELNISAHTVRDHKRSLFKKLQVRNLKELFATAEKYGFVHFS